MKIFKIVFIILASSTYRCSDQETVDCKQVDQELIGDWKGVANYFGPRQANGSTHNFTLTIENSNGCSFTGYTKYDNFPTTFNVSGNVDIFGWVTFTEVSIKQDGGEYADCLVRINSSSRCNQWPDLRWKEGNKFNEARFRRDPYILIGKFERPNSYERGWQILNGTFSLSKN